MPTGKESTIKLPSLDELFSSQEERDDAKLKRIYEIPLDQIDPFPDHPYKVRDDEDMRALVESVRANGIITPAVVRKKEDGRYEILSGHRRHRACEIAGLDSLRCEVVEMKRDEATIFMVESNIHRNTVLPSEKAFAYKMRLEAMNRQGRRSDLTCSPVGNKLEMGRAYITGRCHGHLTGFYFYVEGGTSHMAADIKTRQSNKGTIRTIDRASAMTSHIKDVQARTKEQVSQPRSNDGEQVSSRAQDQMGIMLQRGATGAARFGADAAKAGYRIREGRERMMQRQASSRTTDAGAEREIISLRTRESDVPSGIQRSRVGREKPSFAQWRKRVIGRPARISKKPAGMQKASAMQQYQRAKYAKHAARQSKKTAQRIMRALKAVLQSTRVLIASLSAGGAIALVIILVFVLFGAAFYTFGDDSSDNYIEVSPEVQAYTPTISKYAEQYGIGEYVELIKAIMMQESGGRGTDPMQCSESPYNKKYSHAPGSIKDPEYSIDCGVHYLADCLKQAKCKSPVDMSHIRLALQGYNYGNGYISWAIKRDGGYTVENAAVFSDMQAKKHGWSGYGDKQYPAHVLRYYPYGSYNIGVGNTAIVKVAQQQIGNHGGRKFWSWYGFGGRVSWCGCFVSWCADQCGYIKSGTIPKFSYVPSIVDWAKSHHQWQTRNYKPSPGDIIVIDWYANGTRDHVGIVENCDGRTVHTIEGNRTDQVGRGTYVVGSGTIYGYFVPKY